jgi:hypothetical protein
MFCRLHHKNPRRYARRSMFEEKGELFSAYLYLILCSEERFLGPEK